MSAFLEAAFSLPTAIFSGLLILVAFYWLTFLFGILDLEILDGVFDSVGGAAESLGGATDSIGGAAEGMIEGAAEGAAEGLAEGADGMGDHDGCLGLGGVPSIIILTTFTVFGWLGSYFGSSWISHLDLAASMVALVPWAVGVGSVGASLVATSISLRPLKKVFALPPVTQHSDLVGKVCTVTTLRVDGTFGQAEVVDNDASTILIQARSRDANTLRRGDKALIFDYDPQTQVFFVAQPRADVETAAPSPLVRDL